MTLPRNAAEFVPISLEFIVVRGSVTVVAQLPAGRLDTVVELEPKAETSEMHASVG